MNNEDKYEPTPQEKAETFGIVRLQQEIKDAESSAYRSEAQGQVLASHVIDKLIAKGKTEDRAKVGKFPNRYPYDIDQESVTLATNAALKERGVDAKVDVYDATVGSYDTDIRQVALTQVNGQPIEPSYLYGLRKK